jgi:shikimate kinase / 3-dehydroquinate synthase
VDIQRVVLIGFSGTGKSTIARKLADSLNWTAIDTDRAIEIVAGKTIPEIFAEDGESAFRDIERQILLRSLEQMAIVVATGGGAVVSSEVWTAEFLNRPGTLTVALDSSPATILQRLQDHQAITGETVERPLLAGNDPLSRITELKQSRQPAYDQAALTLVTDAMTVADVVDQIRSLVSTTSEPASTLKVPGGESRIFVRPGISSRIGSLIAEQWPRARTAFVVTDSNVGPIHASPIKSSLESSGLVAQVITVPSGEGSKSWASAGNVVDAMLDQGIQRNDVVVALGGGVIGDLAGFAAAVVLRGVGVVQIPTTLLAMVDSSVGGKTGVNHPAGKNLIGAFYQPRLVCVDPQLLETLPGREMTQGWAEVVKHAVIQPSTPDRYRSDLMAYLDRNHANLIKRREPALSYAILRNIALKASVVEADERETSLRAILNYGHTIGHAIEAAEYRYLHGEAVSVGIHAANRIAVLTGRIDQARELQIAGLAAKYGLPATAIFDPTIVKAKMKSDKKRATGQQTWVLPVEPRGVALVTEIDESTVDQALESVRTTE